MTNKQSNVMLNPIHGKISKNPHQPTNVYNITPIMAPIRKGMQHLTTSFIIFL